MSARSKKPKCQVYGDFLGDVRKEPKIWCEQCERWIPPSYFKKGRPEYIHTCYSEKERARAEALADAKKEGAII